MYLCYDEAVQAGLNAYRTIEYVDSRRSAFRVATMEFKKYLEENGLPYSPELAQQWINDSKEHWSIYKFKISRKTMSEVLQFWELVSGHANEYSIADHRIYVRSVRVEFRWLRPTFQLVLLTSFTCCIFLCSVFRYT